MCKANVATFVASLLPLLVLTISCANREDVDSHDGVPNSYPSPTAVFDAYREAREKRECRKCFSLLTSEAQNDALFESFFACGMHDSKESRAILKKYGLDDAALGDALRKKYKERYGIDIDTAEGAASVASLGDSDRELLVDVVAAHVKDKAGFFEAEINQFEKESVSPLGDLEQLVVDDHTATGRAATPGFHYETPPGKAHQKIEDKIYQTFKFRRVNGGWLLDSL
jgi:hypothetical protein